MQWEQFDGAGLLLHIGGIIFVGVFVLLGQFALGRKMTGRIRGKGRGAKKQIKRRMLRGLASMLVLGPAGTAIVYAALFDSRLLLPFDMKGVMTILFGGMWLATARAWWLQTKEAAYVGSIGRNGVSPDVLRGADSRAVLPVPQTATPHRGHGQRPDDQAQGTQVIH